MSSFDDSKDEHRVPNPNITHDAFINRRPSNITRPKTSIGRNHSLFNNGQKDKISLIHTKVPRAKFASTRANFEQGNVQSKVNETLQDFEASYAYQTTTRPMSSAQGQPKLTKNYSLNTIFEKKR